VNEVFCHVRYPFGSGSKIEAIGGEQAFTLIRSSTKFQTMHLMRRVLTSRLSAQSALHVRLCSLACAVGSSAVIIASIGDGQEGDACRFQIDTSGGNTPTTQVGKFAV
jgi:hypothetical protein